MVSLSICCPKAGYFDVVFGHQLRVLFMVVNHTALAPKLNRKDFRVNVLVDDLHALFILRVNKLHLLDSFRVKEIFDNLKELVTFMLQRETTPLFL